MESQSQNPNPNDNTTNTNTLSESVTPPASNGEDSVTTIVIRPPEDSVTQYPSPIAVDASEVVHNEKTPEADQGFHSLDELIEPEVGMIFDTAEEAFDFYNEYARKIGFRVRIQRTNMNKANRSKIHRQVLVCSCEGAYKMIRKPRKRRENKRFGCLAVFEIKLITGDKYALIRFKSEHTHDLVPPKFSHYLKTPKKLQSAQIGITDKMQSSGTKQAEIVSSHPEDGIADPNNLEHIAQAGFLKKGDVDFLLDYFKQKKRENKHFFYSFRTNEDGKICGVFFCDAKSRRDYGLFGDSVCFDTTLRTNNYDMVCTPIIGINNHGQPTLFGCGLLDGETTDVVVWLFTTFLEAMGGKKPISVFTDQSAAISNAVGVVFPESHHGLCLWHIFQNASKHMTKVFKAFKSFTPQLKATIYDPETIEEFEHSWNNLLEEFGLIDNEWLQGLYDLRKEWAHVYSRGHFCAGMTTKERNEIINKFLKAYFSTGSMLLREFVDQYSKAMDDQCEKEREVEKKTLQTSPNLISGWSVEREASKIYTREMFYGFQEGLQHTIDLLLELEKDDGTIRTYRATEMEGQKKIHTLTYNHLEQSVSCTCRKFDFNGILCSHALKLFRDLQYKSLPSQYYLKRWTRKITDEDIFDPFGELIPNENDPSSTARYNELTHISQRIVTKGSKLEEAFSLTKSLLLDVEAKVEVHISSKEERRVAVQQSTPNTHQNPVSNLNEVAPTQEVFGLVQQQPNYSQNGWQWMSRQVIHPQGVHPPDIIQPYNFVGSQQQRTFLPNDLFMSQQGSSSQIHAPREMPH